MLVAGAVASVFGSLVGLGGAFVIIPIVRLGFGFSPAVASGTTLVFVLANTLSASAGFLRHKLVDVRLALWFGAAAVPASVLGAMATRMITPAEFDVGYGTLLVVLSIATVLYRNVVARPAGERTVLHAWWAAVPTGFVLGFSSSLFGIGGGIIVVPLMLMAARMPAHVAAATSSFVILLTAPVGVLVKGLNHEVAWLPAVPLLIGGLGGGYVAPSIARRISSPRLVQMMALAFILAAAGLIARHL